MKLKLDPKLEIKPSPIEGRGCFARVPLKGGKKIAEYTGEKISDAEAKLMARDIATKIEQELKYPGEIKVTMIRETRIIEYAR